MKVDEDKTQSMTGRELLRLQQARVEDLGRSVPLEDRFIETCRLRCRTGKLIINSVLLLVLTMG